MQPEVDVRDPRELVVILAVESRLEEDLAGFLVRGVNDRRHDEKPVAAGLENLVPESLAVLVPAADGKQAGQHRHPDGPRKPGAPALEDLPDRLALDHVLHGVLQRDRVAFPDAAFQEADHVLQVLVALFPFHPHARARNAPQEARRAGVQALGRSVAALVNQVDRLRGERAGERRPSREHLVEHHAQGVDIRAAIHVFRIVDLFRGDIGRRAQHHPLPGEAVLGVLQGSGDAEVHQLHLALAGEQDVARLDVAVDDLLVMGVFQGLAHLVHDEGGRVVGEVALPPDQGIQRDAVNVLFHDVIGMAFLEVIVHLHDAVVLEVHHDARFALEPLDELAAAAQGELLQEHRAVQGGMPRLVEGPHAALGDLGDDLVFPDHANPVFFHVTPLSSSVSGHTSLLTRRRRRPARW